MEDVLARRAEAKSGEADSQVAADRKAARRALRGETQQLRLDRRKERERRRLVDQAWKAREQEHQQKWPKGHIKQVGIKTTEDAAREWEKGQEKA